MWRVEGEREERVGCEKGACAGLEDRTQVFPRAYHMSRVHNLLIFCPARPTPGRYFDFLNRLLVHDRANSSTLATRKFLLLLLLLPAAAAADSSTLFQEAWGAMRAR